MHTMTYLPIGKIGRYPPFSPKYDNIFLYKSIMEIENEQLPKSVDFYITAIKEQIDTPTPFALETLNPFENTDELHTFSTKHNEGAGITVGFPNSFGFGEQIQSEYILQTLQRFFPKINTDPTQTAQTDKIIPLKMADYMELENSHKAYGDGSKFEYNPKEIVFSMAQTKILHSGRPKRELSDAFKQRLFREAGIAVPKFILTGPMNPLFFCDLPEDYTFISAVNDLHLESFSKGAKTFDKRLSLQQRLIQRVLFSIADFACIPDDRNKIEVCADIPTITPFDEYNDPNINSNIVTDHELRKRRRIFTKAEIMQSGGLAYIDKPPLMTEEDIRDIYFTYMNSPQRPISEISLKESMKQLCKQIAAT